MEGVEVDCMMWYRRERRLDYEQEGQVGVGKRHLSRWEEAGLERKRW
jgi:hypothetical protein